MSLNFFDAESVGTGSLPFANDFLDENPRQNGNIFPISEIKLVNSGKGYLFTTARFSGFLWKNTKTTKQIIEALAYYVTQAYGFELIAKLDKTVKGAVMVGVDSDKQVTWYALGNGYTTQEGLSTTPEEGGNPFLIPVPPTPTMLTNTVSLVGQTGTTTRKEKSAS